MVRHVLKNISNILFEQQENTLTAKTNPQNMRRCELIIILHTIVTKLRQTLRSRCAISHANKLFW